MGSKIFLNCFQLFLQYSDMANKDNTPDLTESLCALDSLQLICFLTSSQQVNNLPLLFFQAVLNVSKQLIFVTCQKFQNNAGHLYKHILRNNIERIIQPANQVKLWKIVNKTCGLWNFCCCLETYLSMHTGYYYIFSNLISFQCNHGCYLRRTQRWRWFPIYRLQWREHVWLLMLWTWKIINTFFSFFFFFEFIFISLLSALVLLK